MIIQRHATADLSVAQNPTTHYCGGMQWVPQTVSKYMTIRKIPAFGSRTQVRPARSLVTTPNMLLRFQIKKTQKFKILYFLTVHPVMIHGK